MIDRRKFIQTSSLLTLPLVIPSKLWQVKPIKKKNNLADVPVSTKAIEWTLLSKVTYWPRKKDLQKLKEDGFNRYIHQQLNAPVGDSKEVQRRIEELKVDIKYEYNGYTVDEWRNITYLDKDLGYCRKEFEKIKERGWFEWIRPAIEVQSANWIRAVYSPWQLREMMVEFWHDHFNVTVNGDMAIGCCIPTYDRDVIRKNAFGNFRVFLEDVAKSPAMLYYLNNKASQASPANENYARELFELHTLGQEHYYNSLYDQWRDVPGALEGKPAGYIDEDVYEAARAFTGWTVADGSPFWRSSEKENFPDTGEFYYFEGWHDNYQKRILGHEIKSNMPPMYDGKKVLDLLASHPSTAKTICKKFLVRFMGEAYPESLLNKAQAVWMENVNTPDQIKKTLQTIFESEEFQTQQILKVKRPYEFLVSAARATDAEFTPNMMLQWQAMNMGHKPFMWPAPTGHPDKDTYWMGPGAMLIRWRMAGTIMYWKKFGVYTFDLAANTPNGKTYEEIVDYWSEKVIGSKLPDKHREQVIAVVADGSKTKKPEQEKMEEKLTSLVRFLLSTPDFQYR